MKTLGISIRIWFFTGLAFGMGWLLYSVADPTLPCRTALPATAAALVGGIPVIGLLWIALGLARSLGVPLSFKMAGLFLVCAACCAVYGLGITLLTGGFWSGNLLTAGLLTTAALLACSLCGLGVSFNRIRRLFTPFNQSLIKYNQMETSIHSRPESPGGLSRSNKILIKAAITGGLILLLLIPTLFISNLVTERQERQAAVVSEVSGRWAKAQVLTGPYLDLPYKQITVSEDKKVTETLNHLTILPDVLDMDGRVFHELRLRSIYKVLLYRADLQNSGNFEFTLPKEMDKNLVQWKDAKICYGLSDFKGIEEKLMIRFNGSDYELSPGLPDTILHDKGLSAAIPLADSDQARKISFSMTVKIKGSEQLHFVPMAGDSRFTLRSDWPSPSFDGSDLPAARTVDDTGFTATWKFNKANLPFGTVLKDFTYDTKNLAFGVSLLQPADGYAKTDRCIKYAILFIGLTFSLFFVIELMQKKPVHPVQYVLIGLALVIFYTLLLSISEFIAFDISYGIAAAATILLITLYAYSHFKSARTAGIFGATLMILYGFTFILIRLEDTALLLGSVGLFIILALIMYVSRKINWYGEEPLPQTATPQ